MSVPVLRAEEGSRGFSWKSPSLSADQYAARARGSQFRLAAVGALIALVSGILYAGTGLDSPILPLLLLIGIAIPLLLWAYPHITLYGTYAMVCVVEMLPLNQADSITDRIPIFWNVNTIVQTYGHMNFKAVPLDLFEVLLIVAGGCSLFRAVFNQRAGLRGGPLLGVILGYLFFVMVAVINGETSGGDYRIALQEIRAQFYFLFVYLMVVNLVTERRQVGVFIWMTAITLAIKGFLYTFRQYVTLHGAPLPDQGVGSHEEAFLFDGFFFLLFAVLLCGVYPKQRNFMLIALPVVILGNLATNRRAGTAAFAVLLPVILMGAYRALPNRRRLASIAAISIVVGFSIYYPLFKDSSSILALPARSIKSQFAPDDRDRNSNLYRDAENLDQMATIKSAPLGFGYGKHFIHAVPIADISSMYAWWDLIPHNQILWIWMRTGTPGFFAFWVMISTAIIYSAQVFCDDSLPIELRMLGLYAILVIGCQLIFGMLDLQMTNYRDMMFTATWVGMATRARTLAKRPGPDTAPAAGREAA